MNYKNIYQNIINKAINRKDLDKPYDKHHIIPVSLGGTNSKNNIVKLTLREHFVCHLLLAKIHGKGMLHAAIMMSSLKRYNSRTYAWLRNHYIVECMMGNNNPSRRFPKTQEQKDHFRQTSLNRKWINNGIDSCMAKGEILEKLLTTGWKYGRLQTEKLKIGTIKGGKKTGGHNKGISMSTEQRQQLSEIVKKRTQDKNYKNSQCKKWRVISPDKKEYIVEGLTTFCRNNNLGTSTGLIRAGQKNQPVTKGKSFGWIAFEIDKSAKI